MGLTQINARDYQTELKALLGRNFTGHEVIVEWSIRKRATDRMTGDPLLYAPRVDVAVGPFNESSGRDHQITRNSVPTNLQRLFRNLEVNPNPRCLIAIEVTYSGSSKHILGDIMNASAMGLYGIVVGKPEIVPKIKRNIMYLQRLSELDKPHFLPKNLLVLSTDELRDLLTPSS